MKILTLNTWNERGPWRERWKIIFKSLKQFQPDVAAFQEVFNADWAQEVQKKAGYTSLVFFPEPSGLMLLSRFPVLRSECLTMKTQSSTEDYKRFVLFMELQINNLSFQGGDRNFIVPARSLERAELEAPVFAAEKSRVQNGISSPIGRRNDTVAVFNTHLSWKPAEADIRSAQVEELLNFINEYAEGQLTIVTGDFNAAPDTVETQKMTGPGNFTDTFAALNPGADGLTWDNRNPFVRAASAALPDRRIDYIFIRNYKNKAELSTSKVVLTEPNEKGIFASDHYGVLTGIRPLGADPR